MDIILNHSSYLYRIFTIIYVIPNNRCHVRSNVIPNNQYHVRSVVDVRIN